MTVIGQGGAHIRLRPLHAEPGDAAYAADSRDTTGAAMVSATMRAAHHRRPWPAIFPAIHSQPTAHAIPPSPPRPSHGYATPLGLRADARGRPARDISAGDFPPAERACLSSPPRTLDASTA